MKTNIVEAVIPRECVNHDDDSQADFEYHGTDKNREMYDLRMEALKVGGAN